MEKKTYFDLSANISESLTIFPGDPQYIRQDVACLHKGSPFNLSTIQLGNHIGTHIDFPAHVINNGKNSDDYCIDDLIGDDIIIEVPINRKSITGEFIKTQPILKNDIVFFKTANSIFSKNGVFIDDYVYIEPSAVNELFKRKIKIVGIDYISVDKFSSTDLPVHTSLLANDVLIVENLELSNISAGRYTFFIMPIKIGEMDGLPARVIAQK